MSEGELLTGDGVTQGIVRIGDTVRRPLRPFSLTVQAYLAHLRDAGFTGAPLPFGVDEQGREMLSFVPGDVPRNPLPPETAGDDVLVALAQLIRTLHQASAGWVPPPDAVWGGTPANVGRPITERTELVSHCDYYPGNVVFRDGLPVALIDFDLAHPTTQLYDIANALWYWAPLRDPRDRAPAFADADIPHRVAVFADAYGMTARHRAELAPFAVNMARRYHEDSRASAELDPVFRKLWEDGAKDELPRAEAWLREAAPAITVRLGQLRLRRSDHRPALGRPPDRLCCGDGPGSSTTTVRACCSRHRAAGRRRLHRREPGPVGWAMNISPFVLSALGCRWRRVGPHSCAAPEQLHSVRAAARGLPRSRGAADRAAGRGPAGHPWHPGR